MKYNLIIKPKKFDFFTVIPSYILRHKGISVGATGLYAWLFSHKSEQQINVEFICGHFKENHSAVRSKINELIKFGYLERKRIYVNGKIAGINYMLSDKPLKADNLISENLNLENLNLENQAQSNINNKSNIIKESNNKNFNKTILNAFPHFLKLFPTRYLPETQSQKFKWLDCLEKLEKIDKIDIKQLYLVVKFIREHEFWSEHFLTLLKLRNKDKNGIKYVHKYFETYKNANKPKFYWKIKGIIKYFIYEENGSEKIGATTKTGKLNYFNLNQVFNKHQLKELKEYIKNE